MVCGPKEVCEGMENILGRELKVDMKQLKKRKIFVYENWWFNYFNLKLIKHPNLVDIE